MVTAPARLRPPCAYVHVEEKIHVRVPRVRRDERSVGWAYPLWIPGLLGISGMRALSTRGGGVSGLTGFVTGGLCFVGQSRRPAVHPPDGRWITTAVARSGRSEYPGRDGRQSSSTRPCAASSTHGQRSRPCSRCAPSRNPQPTSLDLRLGARLWQLQCSFLPGAGGIERKPRRVATASHTPRSQTRPTVLPRGAACTSPRSRRGARAALRAVWGRGNPKSSRDGARRVRPTPHREGARVSTPCPTATAGSAVTSRLTPPVVLHVAVRSRRTPWASLASRTASPVCSPTSSCERQTATPCAGGPTASAAPVTDDLPPGILLSVDLEHPDGGAVGYMARRHLPPIDLQRRNLPVDRVTGTRSRPPSSGRARCSSPSEQFYVFATPRTARRCRRRPVRPTRRVSTPRRWSAAHALRRVHRTRASGGPPRAAPERKLVLEIRTPRRALPARARFSRCPRRVSCGTRRCPIGSTETSGPATRCRASGSPSSSPPRQGETLPRRARRTRPATSAGRCSHAIPGPSREARARRRADRVGGELAEPART
jgi:hypothetical protein